MAAPAARFSSPSRWSRTLAHTVFACVASLLLHAVALGGLAWLYRSTAADAVAQLDVQIASVYLAPAALPPVQPMPPVAPVPPPSAPATPAVADQLPSPPRDLPLAAARPAPLTHAAEPEPARVQSPAPMEPAPMAAASFEPATASAPAAVSAVASAPAAVSATARTSTADAARSSALAVEWRVQDWLAQHRQYPRAARRSGAEGTVWVRFVVDRAGSLHGSEILESSGHAVLDRAALDLLQRAAPFPALPSDLAMDEIELVLPIEYDLTRAARG